MKMSMNPAVAADGPPRDGAGAELALVIPRDHVGPYFMSSLGRMVWWTGRVAIGLRYEPRNDRSLPQPHHAQR